VTRTPRILRQGWRFHSHRRLGGGGSATIHVSLAEPRLERRRLRPTGHARPVEVYFFDGEPCFSPAEAASRAALAPPLPAPPAPRQLELLA